MDALSSAAALADSQTQADTATHKVKIPCATHNELTHTMSGAKRLNGCVQATPFALK